VSWCCRRSSVTGDRSVDHRRHVLPKCGKHSVGVHHQYCGQLGKQANCQVVVTLSIANHHASLPVDVSFYLRRHGPTMRHAASKPTFSQTIRTRPALPTLRARTRSCVRLHSGKTRVAAVVRPCTSQWPTIHRADRRIDLPVPRECWRGDSDARRRSGHTVVCVEWIS